jgi:hypothetical protein
VFLAFLCGNRRGLDLFGWDNGTADFPRCLLLRAGEQRDISVLFRANMAAGEYFITVRSGPLATMATSTKCALSMHMNFVVEHTPQLFTASVLNLESATANRSAAGRGIQWVYISPCGN